MNLRLNLSSNFSGTPTVDRNEAVYSRAMLAHDANRKERMFAPIPDIVKRVMFWCAVFAVVVISADLITEMGSDRQVASPSAQPAPRVSTTASATEQAGPSERSNARRTRNVAEAAESSQQAKQ